MTHDKKSEELIDIGALYLAQEIKAGRDPFAAPPSKLEQLVDRPRSDEERLFARQSCWDTARC